MSEPFWVTVDIALLIHSDQFNHFGGAYGVRDMGLLESALEKAKNLHHYGEPTLPEMAAQYIEGIVKNHPFVDGNKRVGLAVGVTFLKANGVHLKASNQEAVRIILELAAGQIGTEELVAWLVKNV